MACALALFVLGPLVPSSANAWELSALDRYLAALEEQTGAELPLSEEVTFNGSLLPQPIVGREQVLGFLNQVLPSIELTDIKQRLEGPDGACAELVFHFPERGVSLDEVHCLTIKDGSITAIRLYFDPRPYLEATVQED